MQSSKEVLEAFRPEEKTETLQRATERISPEILQEQICIVANSDDKKVADIVIQSNTSLLKKRGLTACLIKENPRCARCPENKQQTV